MITEMASLPRPPFASLGSALKIQNGWGVDLDAKKRRRVTSKVTEEAEVAAESAEAEAEAAAEQPEPEAEVTEAEPEAEEAEAEAEATEEQPEPEAEVTEEGAG
jgi:hypothetical protein